MALAILAVVLGAAFARLAPRRPAMRSFACVSWPIGWHWDRLACTGHAANGPHLGSGRGNSDEAGHSFVWREEVVPTPNPRFRRIEVSVSAGDSGHVIARQTGFLVHTP